MCNYLAFADHLVLFAESQQNLSLIDWLLHWAAVASPSMLLNAHQWCSMSTIGIPLLTLHLFRRNNSSNGSNAILQISWIADLLQGGESNVLPKLRSQLENIDRAPLKPQQRLFIVKQNVIPATYHQLVLGKVSKGLLNGLDCKIR